MGCLCFTITWMIHTLLGRAGGARRSSAGWSAAHRGVNINSGMSARWNLIMGEKSVDTGLLMYANKSEWTGLFKDWIEGFFLSWILWDVKGSFILLRGSVIWMDCLSLSSQQWKDSSSPDHWRELILLTWTCWGWLQLPLPAVAGWTCWLGPQTRHCEWHRSGCVCGHSWGPSLAKRGVSRSRLCWSLGQSSVRRRKIQRGAT